MNVARFIRDVGDAANPVTGPKDLLRVGVMLFSQVRCLRAIVEGADLKEDTRLMVDHAARAVHRVGWFTNEMVKMYLSDEYGVPFTL